MSARRAAFLAVVCVACGIDARGALVEESASIPTRAPAPEPDASATPDASDETTIPVDPELLCDPADTTLVACFAFDGTLADQSRTRIAPLMATDITFAAGREGQAAVFTQSPKTDLRLPPEPLNTVQMTIAVWVKPASIPVDPGRYMLFDQNGRFGMILHSDATITCNGATAATKAVIGTWHHIACVHDGAMLSMYVDGQLESSVAAAALPNTADFVGVGEDSTSALDNFDGQLDSLRVWSRALSGIEISAAASR